jgi:hypothetical protein
MYTRHLPSFHFPYSDSIEMSGSSDLLSSLPQLDLYAYIDSPPIERLLVNPHLDFGTFVVSKDTSSVAIMN